MRIARFVAATSIAAVMSASLLRAADTNNYLVTILVSNEPGKAPVSTASSSTGGGLPTAPQARGGLPTTDRLVDGLQGTRREAVTGGDCPRRDQQDRRVHRHASSQILPVIRRRSCGRPRTGRSPRGGEPCPTRLHAVVKHSEAEAIYKGLAIHGNTLYTTDFAGCSVDTLDGTFTEFDSPGGFEDPSIPSDYCPFGIQAIGDSIFVTYALKGGEDDVAGQGHGFVREFDVNGNLVAAVANHGQLNSPWGLAMAPSTFGRLAGVFSSGTLVMARSTPTAWMATDSSTIREHCGRIENLSSSTGCGASGSATMAPLARRMCCTSPPARMRK